MSLLNQITRDLGPNEQKAVKQILGDAKREFANLFEAELAKDPTNPMVFHVGSEKEGITIHLNDISDQRLRELGKLQDSTSKFEAMLFAKMLEAMERTVPKSQFDGAMGQMGKDMFRETMSEELAKNSGAGVAATMFRQLARTFMGQEATTILRESAATTAKGNQP